MNRLDYSGLVIVGSILAFFSYLFVTNGLYIALALLTLIGIIHFTFRRNIINVFTFLMLFHWVQIVSYVFYVNHNWAGNMDQLSLSSGKAYLSALVGLMVMCLVFSSSLLNKLNISAIQLQEAALRINPRRSVYLFFILYGVSLASNAFAFVIPALTQVLINLALLKWVGFVLLGLISYYRKEYRLVFILAFLFDFASGFFSYFSSFKEVFFYTAVVVMTFTKSISLKTSVKTLMAAGVLFLLAILWTMVKGDYRSYLNGGSGQQVIRVSRDAAFTKLSDLVTQLEKEDLSAGTGELFYRVQYVYHLAKAMDNVPTKLPHEYGSIWGETIRYTTVPRFLAPNKAIYQASKKTNKYTGIRYAGYNQGVSFSLGYFADCYVDFGIPGMFLALSVLAFLWVLIFRYFLFRSSNNLLFNYAVLAAFFVQFYTFEMDGTFLFGRMFTTAVFFFLMKFTLFPVIERYLTSLEVVRRTQITAN